MHRLRGEDDISATLLRILFPVKQEVPVQGSLRQAEGPGSLTLLWELVVSAPLNINRYISF